MHKWGGNENGLRNPFQILISFFALAMDTLFGLHLLQSLIISLFYTSWIEKKKKKKSDAIYPVIWSSRRKMAELLLTSPGFFKQKRDLSFHCSISELIKNVHGGVLLV